jgi:O-acetyl-ADP-ribose deacetylase (regulator of RNase III)
VLQKLSERFQQGFRQVREEDRGGGKSGEVTGGFRVFCGYGLPMRWTLKTGNITNEPADVLICSANPHLTLSGGVGADLLARYGPAMQKALEKLVKQRTPHVIPQGEIVSYADIALPYRAILHAVAIDGWYDSSPQIIKQTVTAALRMAAGYGGRRVALTALATGFGRLSLAEFAEGIRPLIAQEFPPIDEIRICLLEDYRIRELAELLTEATVVDGETAS